MGLAQPLACPVGCHVAQSLPGASVGGGGGSEPLLLDTYTGAAAAYSLRKLRTAYTGAAIRVRRSSDNAEQDIGFSGNELDTASLLTFCGAGNGFVVTWYDQTTNAKNATQGTTTRQPVIVVSGSIEQDVAKPCVTFTGANNHNLALSNTASLSMHTVLRQTQVDLRLVQYPVAGVASGLYTGGSFSGIDGIAVLDASGNTIASTVEDTNRHLVSIVANALQVDGNSAISGTYAGVTVDCIGARSDSIMFNFPGKMQEVILWSTDRKSNVAAISSAINAYWGVY